MLKYFIFYEKEKIMDYKKYIAEKINVEGIDKAKLSEDICFPPNTEFGDYALPCFKYAKVLRKSPVAIAEDIKNAFALDNVITEVTNVNGYLNFRINRNGFAESLISEILKDGNDYGKSNLGENKTICIDYSSINIAKPFHIGHLSTTVIGGALYRIYKFLGYNVVGINHLGDYGTQFGKLISAYKRWGDEKSVENGGIRELMRLYVKFHEEAEKDKSLEDEARSYFKLIEEGDKECNEIFNKFKSATLTEIQKIYDLLQIKFDSYAGESFYNDKMQVVVDELEKANLLVESDGAKVVKLDDYDMPPCFILRSDGASLYATRDLAAAFYRAKEYNFDKCLYVVAYQQDLHFKQVFKVLELLNKPYAKDMVHVSYGMVSLEEGTMSTRKGNVIFLEDVISRCVEKALSIMEEKNAQLENKESVAKMVGVGSVIFGALSNNKMKDIVFSYDKVLNFDGETCPYVQYTGARCKSVLQKTGDIEDFKIENMNEYEYELVNHLGQFKDVVVSASERYEPSLVTRYAIELAKIYNKFYFECRIMGEDKNTENFRKALTKTTLIVLENAMGLLGIQIPDRM